MSAIDEVKILLAFIRNADSQGNIDFKATNISHDLSILNIESNALDTFLLQATEKGVIGYEEIGDEGFEPIIIASINPSVHLYLLEKMNGIEKEMQDINHRLTSILNFNPAQLSKEISLTQKKLIEVKEKIRGDKVLESLNVPINLIATHFEGVKRVSESYEEIYKNIIRPVQEEGRHGIRATVKWAILSVVISSVISIIIGNWGTIVNLFKAGK